MEIPYTRKSLIQGNNLYKAEPLVNIRGNHLQRENNYTRKPLIYGNSCKVNAFFNKGAHPRPSLFEESSVHLKLSKTIGKTKETKTTKEVKTKTIKNHRENQKNQTKTKLSVPCRPKWAWVWKLCFLYVILVWCSQWFLIVFALTSLVLLVSLVFPMVCDMFKCTFVSSKRLGRGCVPLLNKAFTLHEFPFMRGFLV